jgi:hypothetical protein
LSFDVRVGAVFMDVEHERGVPPACSRCRLKEMSANRIVAIQHNALALEVVKDCIGPTRYFALLRRRTRRLIDGREIPGQQRAGRRVSRVDKHEFGDAPW